MNDAAIAVLRRKFQCFFAQQNDYRIFVGVPLVKPTRWDEVFAIEADALAGKDLRTYRVAEVRSWIVTYSGTDEIVDGENLFAPLPDGISTILSSALPVPQFLDADLKFGRAMVEIQFGKSSTHPENPVYYSTSFTNLTKHKIRCNSFGAYRKTMNGFNLFTVTNTLFSNSQFEEWYGIRRGGWIEPGETVCDQSNYGRDCIWVYHCETDSNIKFHTGKRCPKLGFFSRLLEPFRR